MHQLFEEEKVCLGKVSSLMNELKNTKRLARLKKTTALKPVQRNQTRWMSNMVTRYIELKPHLDTFEDTSIIDLIPNTREHQQLLLLKE